MTPAPDETTRSVGDRESSTARGELPRGAAGAGYRWEWALFCDYAAATGQPVLPTTVAALAGFFTALPARPATQARRVRAIAAAHRRAGLLLPHSEAGPAALHGPVPQPRVARTGGPEPSEMVAACATRGWPHGLHGRRDAYLVVTTHILSLSPARTRALVPAGITYNGDGVLVGEQVVPVDGDPRLCPACAVVRWLDILGILDGVGRGSARMDLTAAHAPTTTDPHRHQPRAPQRWRDAATLLPAIDRHGWHDDYRPITARSIHTRLARTAARAGQHRGEGMPIRHTAEREPLPAERRTAGHEAPSLDEVLVLLDGVADDADALNDRITTLLDGSM